MCLSVNECGLMSGMDEWASGGVDEWERKIVDERVGA